MSPPPIGPNWAKALEKCECDQDKPPAERCNASGFAFCASAWNEYARLMLAGAERRARAEGLPS